MIYEQDTEELSSLTSYVANTGCEWTHWIVDSYRSLSLLFAFSNFSVGTVAATDSLILFHV